MKSVLVTGGTTRLGLAIADRLRADGWRVLTSSHRPDAGADLIADLTEPMGPARLYAEALKCLNGIPPDALVNNAALFVGERRSLEALNFTAPKKLIQLMAGRESVTRGAVVNILDTRVMNPNVCLDDTTYERSKRQLLAYTRTSAVTFAETLTVNGVAPGPVLAPTGVHESAGELLVARPTPADVAAAVAYLLSAPATTGSVIPVDGGQALLNDEEREG